MTWSLGGPRFWVIGGLLACTPQPRAAELAPGSGKVSPSALPTSLAPQSNTQRAAEAAAPAQRPFGCTQASECRRADAKCLSAILVGKCSCSVDADCAPSELCYGDRCEVRCQQGDTCARGGSCYPYFDFCVDATLPSEDRFSLAEWNAKAAAGIPGHDAKMLHGTYDEWDATNRHVRVSFRGDGRYVIEVDGISGWNGSVFTRGRGNAQARELARTGVLTGTSSSTPSIPSLRARSCTELLSGFRAELVLVAEFANLMAYRGVWTHPKCKGFPKEYVDSIWAFAAKITGGALQPFDREKWGELPTLSREHDEPEPGPSHELIDDVY